MDEPLEELLVGGTVSETGTTDLDVIKKTEIGDLMEHTGLVEEIGVLLIVGLDATDVVRRGLGQGLDEVVGLVLFVCVSVSM